MNVHYLDRRQGTLLETVITLFNKSDGDNDTNNNVKYKLFYDDDFSIKSFCFEFRITRRSLVIYYCDAKELSAD